MIDSYAEYLTGSGRSPETVKSQRTILKRFQKDTFHPLTEVSAEDILRFISSETCKNNTRYVRYIVIRGFFDWLQRTGGILVNPMKRISPPRRDKILPTKIMTKSETLKVLEETVGSERVVFRNRVITELMYSCSLRRSELVALNLQDYEASARALVIRKSKNRQGRIVPVGRNAADLLEEYIRDIRPETGSSALFIGCHGKRLSGNTITNMVTEMRRKAEIRTQATSHSFRKSSATHMLKNGASLPCIQALLGHQRMSTTQIYTKVYPKDLIKMHRAHHPREKQKNVKFPTLEMPQYLKGSKVKTPFF